MGPVHRMDDIVPQARQHRKLLVCIQRLLIEFSLEYPRRALSASSPRLFI